MIALHEIRKLIFQYPFSIFLLSSSFLIFVLVIDRIFDAAWQYYKFWGFDGSGGVITLSLTTAYTFWIGVSLVIIVSSFYYRRLLNNQIKFPAKVVKFSLFLTGLSGIMYSILALSSLNVWRP